MRRKRKYLDALFEIAETQLGYFTASQAREAELNPAVLVLMANREVIERVSRGVYRLTRYPSSPRDSLMEAMLWPQAKSGSPLGVISHESALAFYEMSEVSPSKIHVTIPSDARIRRDVPPYLTIHRAMLPPEDIRKVDGILVTTPEKSIHDVAASHLGPALLRQAIEDGARRGQLTASQTQRLEQQYSIDHHVAKIR